MMKLLIGLLLVGLSLSCAPHCSSCNSLYCTACGEGYELTIQGGCTPQTVPNCAIYINATYCKDCQPTFLLSDNNTCEKDYSACTQKDLFELTCSECMFGKVLVDKVCLGNLNCKLPQSNCTECLPGFRLDGAICVDESADCLLSDPTTGVCAMCKDGYVLSGYLCVPMLTPPNCYISGNKGECFSCKQGYQLTPGKQCVLLKNDVCAEFDSQGRCQSCLLPSLRLENGICVDPKCAQGVQGQCTTCINGFKVKSGWICELEDANCLVISTNADRCDSCKPGYLVNVNGTCSLMPPNCMAANIVSLACIQCTTGYLLKTDGKCQMPVRIANCVSINQQTQICNLCANGYYIQGKICAKVSALCSGYDVKSGFCLNCISGYTYFGGQCLDTNCQKRVGDYCEVCKGALLVDSKTGLCIYSDKNCAISSFSGCNACKSGYYWNYMRCVVNPAYCDVANNDGACKSCLPKYVLTKGFCVVPIANCLEYAVNNMNSTCSACQFNFQLKNGSCQGMAPLKDIFCLQFNGNNCINCSSRYYVSNGRCVPVNPNCRTYKMNTGDCIDCYAGYQIYLGGCITSKTGDNNCKNYTNGVCVACYSAFFLNNVTNLCQGISPLCQTSNNVTGACLSCYKGYILSGGECLLAYMDANCIRFDAKGQCVACSSRYFMKNGLCSPISPLCRTYNTTTGDCLGCYPGYFLSSGSCLSGADPTTDLNCKLKDTNLRCLQCYPNYYLHQNGTCILANPLCKSINNTNGDCTSCYPGYLIKGSTCGVPSATDADPNCLTFYQPNNCSQCYASYYLSNGLCNKINLLCKTYNTTNGYCLSCYPGYTLNLQGLCVIPQSEAYVAKDPYCAKFSGFNCVQCAPGFYVGSGTCTAVSPLCKSYNTITGICTSCYSGYSLQKGLCVVIQQIQISFCEIRQGANCKKCMQGYYTQSPQLCSPVSILCGNYDQNTGACLSCITGYFLQGGSCVFPSMGFDANCIGYDVSAYCSMCKPGYYLYNYICTLIDPNCYNFDATQGICLACGNGKQPSGAKCA